MRAMVDFAVHRRKMIDSQLRTNDVTDLVIIAAFGAVAREDFVAPDRRELAYIDVEQPVPGGASRRVMLTPTVFAKLVQLAEPLSTERVLVVGSATGYEAAVLSKIAGSVVALESDPALAAAASQRLASFGNVVPVTGPLPGGWPDGAPYDVILVAGAVEAGLETLKGQLALDGRMAVIEGVGGAASAVVYTRGDAEVSARFGFNAASKVLPGFEKPKAFVF